LLQSANIHIERPRLKDLGASTWYLLTKCSILVYDSKGLANHFLRMSTKQITAEAMALPLVVAGLDHGKAMKTALRALGCR
jgi:hypothetical protein